MLTLPLAVPESAKKRLAQVGPGTDENQLSQIAKFSAKDAGTYPRFHAMLERVAIASTPSPSLLIRSFSSRNFGNMARDCNQHTCSWAPSPATS